MTAEQLQANRAAIVEWLADGETGLSSETMARHVAGRPWPKSKAHWAYTPHHPYDPDDFRRCVLMLESLPHPDHALARCRVLSPTWERLVDAWPELMALWERENDSRAKPMLYAAIKRVRAEADAAWKAANPDSTAVEREA